MSDKLFINTDMAMDSTIVVACESKLNQAAIKSHIKESEKERGYLTKKKKTHRREEGKILLNSRTRVQEENDIKTSSTQQERESQNAKRG